MNERCHIVLFSQTGTEIYNLIEKQIIDPNIVVIHQNKHLKINPKLQEWIEKHPTKCRTLPENPTTSDYKQIFQICLNPLITLHGFRRIIPGEICNEFTIVNLHPADIKTYPELKGENPQKKVIGNSLKYPYIGVTIHSVIAEVDAGDIIFIHTTKNPDVESVVYTALSDLALEAWKTYFKSYLTLPWIYGKPMPQTHTSQSNLIVDSVESKYPETCFEFKRLQQQDYELFCKKQNDYGPNNISLGSLLVTEEDKRTSQSSVIFRCFDKVQRLINLVVKSNKTTPANEPIEDAYADLSNYGLIARIVRNDKWGK